MYNNDYLVLESYLIQAVSTISGSTYNSSEMTCRCNICGDSLKHKSLRRGRLLLMDREGVKHWIYKCWNGDCKAFGEGNSWSAVSWLKTYFPNIYSQYRRETLKSFKFSKTESTDLIADEIKLLREKSLKEKTEKLSTSLLEEKETCKHFKPILSSTNSLFTDAVSYCISRKIPKNIWEGFFIAVDGKYKNRMIIPFYNKENVFYWQGRSLRDQIPKYLNRKVNKENAIYNYYNIDKTKPVIILEGPIDSMFVENGVATLGLQLSSTMKDMLKDCKRYWICDNDEPGKKYSKKYLKSGDYVFMWNKFLKHFMLPLDTKDINDCIMNLNKDKFTFEDLNPFFTNNFYDLIYFQ